MSSVGIFAGMVLVIGGIAAVAVSAWRMHARSGAMAYLTESDHVLLGEGSDTVIPSFADRIIRPMGRGFAAKVRELYPSQHLDRLHQQLLYAGLSNTLRAEELATIQVVMAGAAM